MEYVISRRETSRFSQLILCDSHHISFCDTKPHLNDHWCGFQQKWEDDADALYGNNSVDDDEAFSSVQALSNYSEKELAEAVEELFDKMNFLLYTYFNHHDLQKKKSIKQMTQNKKEYMFEKVAQRMHGIGALLHQQTGNIW